MSEIQLSRKINSTKDMKLFQYNNQAIQGVKIKKESHEELMK